MRQFCCCLALLLNSAWAFECPNPQAQTWLTQHQAEQIRLASSIKGFDSDLLTYHTAAPQPARQLIRVKDICHPQQHQLIATFNYRQSAPKIEAAFFGWPYEYVYNFFVIVSWQQADGKYYQVQVYNYRHDPDDDFVFNPALSKVFGAGLENGKSAHFRFISKAKIVAYLKQHPELIQLRKNGNE